MAESMPPVTKVKVVSPFTTGSWAWRTSAEHDALGRDQLGQLAVGPAGRRSRGIGLPDPVMAAGTLIDPRPG